jgi:histidine triad (HIT) family protein
MQDCIFCEIANRRIETEILFEDDDIIAFSDINPIAPVHVLFIPKKHIESVSDISKEDKMLMGNMIFQAKEMAVRLGIDKNGYKLLFRTGQDGGQEIPHIHLHLIGGAKLYEEIRPV